MEKYQLKHGETYFKKKYDKEIVNAAGYDIEQIFDCTHEQREQFWRKWNQQLNDSLDKFIRVRDWDEVYSVVRQLVAI